MDPRSFRIDRILDLRRSAREEAARREQAVRTVTKTTNNVVPDSRVPAAMRVAPPIAGETVCPRCGTRSSIGCRHRAPLTRNGSL